MKLNIRFLVLIITIAGCFCELNSKRQLQTIQEQYNVIIGNIHSLIAEYTKLENSLKKGLEHFEHKTKSLKQFFSQNKSQAHDVRVKNLQNTEQFVQNLQRNQTDIFFKHIESIENETKTATTIAYNAISAVNGTLPKSQEDFGFKDSSWILESEEEGQCYYKHTSCAEALKTGGESGLYLLSLPGFGIEPFWVYCLKDPKSGPAWTVVLRRADGSVRFERSADDYQHGFGQIDNEYFIGLDILHALTHTKAQEVWVQLEDFENHARAAYYDEFAVAGSKRNFSINVLGQYSGDAGNALRVHAGHSFRTPGQPRDSSDEQNCANHFSGGWWYSNCYTSLLTGEYNNQSGRALPEQSGVHWWDFNDETTWVNLKYAHMAVRPKVVTYI